MSMLALSIRQPWAWLIVTGLKDIENRSWPTSVRGRVLVHAAKGCTKEEYEEAEDAVANITDRWIPPLSGLDRGGIIGSVEIVDCVRVSSSPWFSGPYGFVLRDPRPLPFHALRGQLGFFEVREWPG